MPSYRLTYALEVYLAEVGYDQNIVVTLASLMLPARLSITIMRPMLRLHCLAIDIYTTVIDGSLSNARRRL
jgi:hypothetical protein